MQFNMVLSQNILAIKLYKPLVFNILGILPEAVRNPNGSYQDGYMMATSCNASYPIGLVINVEEEPSASKKAYKMTEILENLELEQALGDSLNIPLKKSKISLFDSKNWELKIAKVLMERGCYLALLLSRFL